MEVLEEKNGRAQLEVLHRQLPLELNAEFTLPDYRSEISRLLWVRPTVLPPEPLLGGGKDRAHHIPLSLSHVGIGEGNGEEGGKPLGHAGDLVRCICHKEGALHTRLIGNASYISKGEIECNGEEFAFVCREECAE